MAIAAVKRTQALRNDDEHRVFETQAFNHFGLRTQHTSEQIRGDRWLESRRDSQEKGDDGLKFCPPTFGQFERFNGLDCAAGGP